MGNPRGYNPFDAGFPNIGEITLTHGDIHPRNIIVSRTSPPKVLALVDWEFVGWYPDYWEYCRARRITVLEDWINRMPKFLVACEDINEYVQTYLDWMGSF